MHITYKYDFTFVSYLLGDDKPMELSYTIQSHDRISRDALNYEADQRLLTFWKNDRTMRIKSVVEMVSISSVVIG